MTYEYIWVHTGNIRVTYEQYTGSIRIYAGKKVGLQAGTPGTQGTGTPTRQERKKETEKQRERQDKKEKKEGQGQEKTKIRN